MTRKIFTAAAVIAMGLTSCTANYLDINSNPYEVDKDQMQADGYAIGAALNGLASAVISTDVNTAQFTECLLGGTMGGYLSDSNENWRYTISNYNPTDDWTNVFMASDEVIPKIYSNLTDLKSSTEDPVPLAIGQIMKVTAMHRVTDTYGPMPYTRIGEDGKLQIPYDSQEEIYRAMFDELNAAIDTLTVHRTENISATADYIYGGNVEKWIRFANSIKLRLAMRVVYADQALAKEMAESAVNHEVGVMTSNADNAKLTSFGEKGNPLYVAVKYNEVQASDHEDGNACQTGGDTHAAADIISYMNGFNDPRRQAYFTESEWEGTEFAGLRRGIIIPSLLTTGHKYSGAKLSLDSPLYWMNAAEVAFLKAEAIAIFNFNMGGADARSCYEEGIRLSFEQWGVTGAETYMASNENPNITYKDPSGTNSYGNVLTELPVAWNEGDTPEHKQERIITQKWIANWLLGNEAWADYRRTGYPRLIPATEEGNKSNGIVDSQKGARRMPYPADEYINNSANITEAVANKLNGPDNMSTRLWWDCKNM